MRASQLRDRARSLSDLVNSQAITYEDELRSLNESYKDVYNQLCNTDFDYFLKEIEIDVESDTIELPEDFYQLRYVDYLDSGEWMPMSKMSPNQRTNKDCEPKYRLRNSSLFIIGSTPKVRVSYYPVPEHITLPDEKVLYHLDVHPFNSGTTTNNWYISPRYDVTTDATAPDQMLYNYKSLFYAESKHLQQTSQLLPYSVDQVEYYRGTIYYIRNGSIYYAPYDPLTSTAIAPTLLTLSGVSIIDILAFNINRGKLYATNATTSIVSEPFGANSDYFMGTVQPAYYPYWLGDIQVYIDDVGQLIRSDTLEVVDVGPWESLAGSPETLLGLDTFNRTWSLKLDPFEKTLHSEDVAYLGGIADDRRVSVLKKDSIENSAMSSDVDFDLVYPTSALYELTAYQMAIDFKRKLKDETTDLMTRLGALWETFMHSMIRQDSYTPERIQNVKTRMWL